MAAAGAACGLAGWLDWPAFLHAWLAGTVSLGLLPLGALAALMTFGLTGGAWGEAAAPVWRALAATLPLFALAMTPLLFGLDTLFPWTAPVHSLPDVVARKTLYLNLPFLFARLALYFALWLGFAFALGVWTRRRPAGAGVCAAGLIALLYSMTFFGFDWLLSLEPKFYTDVFGLWLCVTAAAAACALGLLVCVVSTAPESAHADLAALLLSLILGWAFLAFAQYIIIWSGNLPDEIRWYLERGHGPWRVMSWVIFLLMFAAPFTLLMSRAGRASRRMLIAACASVLAGYLLQVQWWVLPATDTPTPHLLWMSPAVLLALGLVAVFMLRGRAHPASRRERMA